MNARHRPRRRQRRLRRRVEPLVIDRPCAGLASLVPLCQSGQRSATAADCVPTAPTCRLLATHRLSPARSASRRSGESIAYPLSGLRILASHHSCPTHCLCGVRPLQRAVLLRPFQTQRTHLQAAEAIAQSRGNDHFSETIQAGRRSSVWARLAPRPPDHNTSSRRAVAISFQGSKRITWRIT